jgi:hypothetical protein
MFLDFCNRNGLSDEDIKSISIQTGFIKRIRSIGAFDFLHSVCTEVMNGSASCNDVAAMIDVGGGVSVSKQAVWKKINNECCEFFKSILERIILMKIEKSVFYNPEKLCQYKRVIIQDSTITRLPEKLFYLFSGVANKTSKVCNARIQCVYDILNEEFISFSIDEYSKNDLKAAPELEIQEGDLVLRDRGYLTNAEIQRHIDAGADCIYRYKNGMILKNDLSGEEIDILSIVETNQFVDMKVRLNNKEATIVRLVAFPVSQEIADKRRMKAKSENKQPPSATYLKLLSWSIYITTISKEDVSSEDIYKLYCLRWRIEIIFKTWKSNMSFSKMNNVSVVQLYILMYARFIMILLSSQFVFQHCKKYTKSLYNKSLSLMKVTQYIVKYPEKILEIFSDLALGIIEHSKVLKALARYCSYDTRKRLSFEDAMNKLFGLS